MTFLNFTLVFGAAACAIPVVLHLLNRRRYTVVRWGAMHLLAPMVKNNRKRIKLQQLILLLVRMSILALLALCMAGPILTGWHALSGDSKASLAMLLDNSYSMQGGAVGDTNFGIAKKDAAQLIRHQPRGSDVSVKLMAGGTTFGSSPTTNRQRSAKEIAKLNAGYGAADVGASFEDSTRSLIKMQHAKRDLVIVSDFQANDWSGDAATSLERASQLVDSMPIRPAVTLMKVGTQVTDNVSIQSVNLSPRFVAVGQSVGIRVNLRNHGEIPYPGLRVHLRVDGKDEDVRTLDLAEGSDGQLLFEKTFEEAGSHVLELKADADSLHVDNGFVSVVPVWDRLPVLLVDGAPDDDTLGSATGFLQLALSPFLTAAADKKADEQDNTTLPRADLLEAITVSAESFRTEDLDDKRVVILANVSRLTENQLTDIESFVARGNSLLIFAGDQIDSQWYRTQVHSRSRLTAATFDLLRTEGSPDDSDELAPPPETLQNAAEEDVDKPGMSIAGTRFDHPALELFNDPRHGRLSDIHINSWYRLDVAEKRGRLFDSEDLLNPREGKPDRGEATVLARLENGDPFLVENTYGKGQVMQCATSCDDSWSNLPVRPLYLPLMQRLVTYLAIAYEPPRNLSVGQTIVANLPSDADSITVLRPDGEQVEWDDKKNGDALEYSDTDVEGLYTIRVSSREPELYAVTADRDESDLTVLDPDQLESLAKQFEATVARSADEFVEQDSRRRYRREIWRPIFWAMLALVIAEILLQQIFSGQGFRSGGNASPAMIPQEAR